MAGAFSDYMEASVLSWLKGTAFPTAPTTLYVGLFTTLPGDTGTSGTPADGTEVTGGSYARVALTASTGWSALSASGTTGQQISNSGTVTFPQSTASWGTVVGWGIWDAATVGHLLYYGALSASQAIGTSTTASLAAGQIDIAVD